MPKLSRRKLLAAAAPLAAAPLVGKLVLDSQAERVSAWSQVLVR